MDVFRVYISRIDVTDYVDENNPLTELTLKAEDDSIWDFWLDNKTISFDQSLLARLGLTLLTIENIKGKLAQITWYGQQKFRGFVEEARIDPKLGSETIEVDLVSVGWKLCKAPLTQFIISNNGVLSRIEGAKYIFQNRNAESGDTINEIVTAALRRAINYIKYRYNLTISPAPAIDVIDDVDFVQYRSFDISFLRQSAWGYSQGLFQDPATAKVYFVYYQDTKTRDTMEFYELLREGLGSKTYHDASVIGDKIIIYDLSTYNKALGSNEVYWNRISDVTNLEQIKSAIDTYMEFDSTKYLVSDIKNTYQCNDSILYILLRNVKDGDVKRDYLFQIEVQTEDRFRFKYEDVTLGEALKDLAKMSDSIFWMSHEQTLYLKDRENVEKLPVIDEENILELVINTKSRLDELFSIPDAYQVLNQEPYNVESDVINHYDDILNGEFKLFDLTVLKDTLINEGRINLKALPLRLEGRIVDAGQVKEVTFMEDIIKLKTEKRS